MKAPRLSLLALAIAAGLVQAQIRTDGSTNGQAVLLKGPDYQIEQSLGRLAGSNLFHSFQQFNLAPSESATFLLSQAGIQNVISRVTGGTPSLISGSLRLQAQAGQPAFFFINPAGVLFGEGARIEMPGAFHVSTAANLRMADGSRWETGGGDSFSAAAPEAFGFLGGTRAAPVALLQGAQLDGGLHQRLSLSGGDVSIDGAILRSSGGLRIAASGEAAADLPLHGPLAADLGGSVLLSGESLVLVRADGAADAGPLELAAGSLHLGGVSLLASSTRLGSTGRGGAIDIRLRDLLSLDGGSSLLTTTATEAPGGDLSVRANTMLLSGGAYIQTTTELGGAGGTLRLQAAEILSLREGASLYSDASGNGAGGAILAAARDITLDSGAYLQTIAYGAGDAGSAQLSAARLLLLDGGAFVGAESQGQGRSGQLLLEGGFIQLSGQSTVRNRSGADSAGGGDVHLQALALLAMDGQSSVLLSGGSTGALEASGASVSLAEQSYLGAQTDAGVGALGRVQVQATELLSLSGGAEVYASHAASGAAQGVSLRAGSILLDDGARLRSISSGQASSSASIDVLAQDQLLLDRGSTIFTGGANGAAAGNLRMAAHDISILGESLLFTSGVDGLGPAGSQTLQATGRIWIGEGSALRSNSYGDFAAERLRLQAQDITINGGAGLSSVAVEGRGDAAGIDLIASRTLLLDGGARVAAGTQSFGNGGSLLLRGENIHITGGSQISSTAFGLEQSETGSAGLVDIAAARQLRIDGSSTVDSASSSDSGNAGQLSLSAGTELLVNASLINTATGRGTGHAGQLTLSTPGLLRLEDTILGSGTGAAGAAGTVRIHAGQLVTTQTRIYSQTEPGSSGDGGLIDIKAERSVEMRGGSVTTASSGSGAGGDVGITAAQILLSEQAVLSAEAALGSSGQAGSITLQAGTLIRLESGSQASVSSAATVANPTALQTPHLRLQAPHIEMHASQVSATATGNTNAGLVELLAGELLKLRDSSALTLAWEGNGGPLRAEAGGLLWLQNSVLATSVFGQTGNGGDIAIKTGLLFLDGGFIQANTAAANASGGDVRIETDALVASDNRVVVGGDAPLVFDPLKPLNVIQAAAPNGVSGAVAVANTLDIAGSLALLDRSLLDPGGLGRSPCERRGGSSLALAGRGGLPQPALAPLGAPPGQVPPPLAAKADTRLWGDCR